MGAAPTMARPAGDGGGVLWWSSVEAGAERGGPAAARPGGGSQTGGAVTRPDLAAPMAQRPGVPRASSAAARSCTGQRRRRRREGQHGAARTEGVGVEGATREPTRSHHHGR